MTSGNGNFVIEGGITQTYRATPAGEFGIDGFLFDVARDTRVKLENDITDHFVEDNSVVNDNVSFKPTIVTLRGLQGVLVSKSPTSSILERRVPDKLQTIESFLPSYTPYAGYLKNSINTSRYTARETETRIQELRSRYDTLFNRLPGDDPLKKVYNFFENARLRSVPFSVETRVKTFEDMLILSLEVISPEETDDLLDIAVTFKQIRQVDSVLTGFDLDQYRSGGKTQQQESPISKKGNVQGQEVPTSTLYKLPSWALGRDIVDFIQ